MRYPPPISVMFTANRERLLEKLPQDAIVVVHSNDVMPTNADGVMPFRQNNDLYYLTGVDQEETILVLRPGAAEKDDRAVLFVRETSELLAIWEGAKLTKEQASKQSGIKTVHWTRDFDSVFHRLVPQVDKIYLSTNEHLRAEEVVETRNRRFIKKCREQYPLHQYRRLSPLMHELRVRKSDVELDYLQEAIEITRHGFERVLQFMKPGVGEWEVEAEYLHEFVRRRSRGFAYAPIIGSGANACVLHYIEKSGLCDDGELVLMDVGAEFGNYNADMTRTIPVNGRFSPRQKAVYQSVLIVMKHATSLLRPGLKPTDYQNEVLEAMAKELVDLKLLSPKDLRGGEGTRAAVRKYFMHGTSHHLGLDVHDVSLPDQVFDEQMVLTVEPGIYIPEEGIGIRLENNVVIEADGVRDLFEGFPLEVDEIESAMAK